MIDGYRDGVAIGAALDGLRAGPELSETRNAKCVEAAVVDLLADGGRTRGDATRR